MNDGQDEIVSAIQPIVSSFSIVTSSLTQTYAVPDNFIAVKRIVHVNTILDEKSISGLDSSQQWWSSRGTPKDYFIDFTTRTRIGLFPIPVVASTGTMTITYYSQSEDLALLTDVPFNNYRKFNQFHYILALYAAYRGWLVYGDPSMAKFYFEEYALGVDRMKNIINFGPNFNPSFSGERPQ